MVVNQNVENRSCTRNIFTFDSLNAWHLTTDREMPQNHWTQYDAMPRKSTIGTISDGSSTEKKADYDFHSLPGQ